MAAISSGPTFVAPPQEPQPIGMSAASRAGGQGRATLTVAFADNEAVTGWLNGQTDDVAVVFAARAALRVLPTITFSRWPGSGRRTTYEIVLRVFRAVAAAWAVAAYPDQRNALNDAARAALSGLGDLQAPSPIRATVLCIRRGNWRGWRTFAGLDRDERVRQSRAQLSAPVERRA